MTTALAGEFLYLISALAILNSILIAEIVKII
jgi:hypothetical protein